MWLRESARDNRSDVNYCGHTRTRPSVAGGQGILDSLGDRPVYLVSSDTTCGEGQVRSFSGLVLKLTRRAVGLHTEDSGLE